MGDADGQGRIVADFFAMGCHGLYVWGAYGVSIVALALIGGLPLLAQKRMTRRLKEEWLEPPAPESVERP